MVGTSAGIGFSSYLNTRAAVSELSNRLLWEMTRETAEETRVFLAQARPALELSRGSALDELRPAFLGERPPSETDWRQRAQVFVRVLAAHPQFRMLYYADQWGTFTAASRAPDGSLEVDFRTTLGGALRLPAPDPELPVPAWADWRTVYRVEPSGQWTRVPAPVLPYEPRLRPWYQAAAARKGFVWTAPYRFAAQPDTRGITAALPLPGTDGLRGVFGLDLELRVLDELVRQLPAFPEERVYILSSEGSVVAEPAARADDAQVPESGDLPLVRAVQSSDPALRAAAQRLFGPKQRRPKERMALVLNAGGRQYLGAARPFSAGEELGWTTLVLVPEDVVLGPIHQNNRWTLALCITLLVVWIVVARVLALRIARPLRAFADEMERVGELLLEPKPVLPSGIEEIYRMGQKLEQMKRSLRSFQKYVETDLVRLLHQTGEEARLGGQAATMTVFFADVVGFTALSEQLSPTELVATLSDYLEEMEVCVSHHQGIVDKYIGDAVMAFWNSPLRPQPNAELLACAAAVEHVERFQALRDRREAEGRPVLEANIGIFSGEVLVGNIGSQRRMDYTVMGDAVNVACRLEGLNRVYGTRILMGEGTRTAAQGEFETRLVDRVAVRGRTRGIPIYELLGRKGRLDETHQAAYRHYAEGFERYQAREWEAAICCFTQVLELLPADGPARLLLRRCEEYRLTPPPATWTGTYTVSR